VADPTEYLVARLRDALTHDPRVHDQSLDVRIEEGRVLLRGELATRERCDAAVAVAHELFPDAEVVADLRVSPDGPTPQPERL
jgi:osmotically-inducible protein OsmY